MKIETLYIVATHKDRFRPGELSIIIGIKMITPSNDLPPRIGYQIQFDDGIIDYVPIKEEVKTYEIGTIRQIKQFIL